MTYEERKEAVIEQAMAEKWPTKRLMAELAEIENDKLSGDLSDPYISESTGLLVIPLPHQRNGLTADVDQWEAVFNVQRAKAEKIMKDNPNLPRNWNERNAWKARFEREQPAKAAARKAAAEKYGKSKGNATSATPKPADTAKAQPAAKPAGKPTKAADIESQLMGEVDPSVGF